MTLDKKDKKWIRKTFKRYAGIIGEDFVDKIKPITEMQEAQGKLLKTTFNEVGKIKIRITAIELRLDKIELDIRQIKKNTAINTKDIKKIRADISGIKKELMQRPKKKELKILEQRVIILESKLERV